jgi:hypothetical protein
MTPPLDNAWSGELAGVLVFVKLATGQYVDCEAGSSCLLAVCGVRGGPDRRRCDEFRTRRNGTGDLLHGGRSSLLHGHPVGQTA